MDFLFWKNKRVFITGHTGFKGGWLSHWLSELGANITGYSLEPITSPNLYSYTKLDSTIKSIIGDIRDTVLLKESLEKSKPEIIFHLAAQPLVRESYSDPIETLTTNVIGTANLLEHARKLNHLCSVVNITTDKCYENNEWFWSYRENEPLGGQDPYSASKACSEIISNAYRKSFFNPEGDVFMATARAGNVIGGGDWSADRLVPDIIEAYSKDHPVKIRNPNSIRPWQHVLEPIRGYLMLAEKLYTEGEKFAEAWNFGPNETDAKSVKFISEKLSKFWNIKEPCWIAQDGDHPHEAKYLKLDISKAKHKLGWSPILNLERSLELTATWHKEISKGIDPTDVTLKQISEYQSLVADQHDH